MKFPKEESLSKLTTLKMKIARHWPKLARDSHSITLTFPGPMPVSLTEESISKINTYPYVVSEKTDGVRFLLMSYLGVTYLANRNYEFFVVGSLLFDIPTDSEKGLDYLVDGELLIGDDYTYVIHDIITSSLNQGIAEKFFDQRYSAAKCLMEKYVANDVLSVELKKFYSTKDIGLLLKEKKYKSDGYIFTPKTKQVGTHTQYNLFKWKEHHTFDFRLFSHTTGKYDLFAMEDNGMSERCFANIIYDSDENTKLFASNLAENCPEFVNGDIIEFNTNKDANFYYPKTVRKDKDKPNALKNVQRTIENVKNNISLSDLVKYLS